MRGAANVSRSSSTDGLASAVASVFAQALRRDARLAEFDPPLPEGLESLVVNDLLSASQWDLEKVRRPARILELRGCSKACSLFGPASGDFRYVQPVDSSRPSAVRGLAACVRRLPSLVMIPRGISRWDDLASLAVSRFPRTTAGELAPPCDSCPLLGFCGRFSSCSQWFRLGSCAWLRPCPAFFLLALLLIGVFLSHRGVWRSRPRAPSWAPTSRPPWAVPWSACFLQVFLLSGQAGCSASGAFFVVAFCHGPQCSLAVLVPRNAAEERRAAARRPGGLQVGRQVLQKTGQNRQRLLDAFSSWLSASGGPSLHDLLFGPAFNPERIANWIVSYGQEMYSAGRPYWQYSEPINSISCLKPILRRPLTPA